MSRGWQGDGLDGGRRLTYVPQMLDVIWGIDQLSFIQLLTWATYLGGGRIPSERGQAQRLLKLLLMSSLNASLAKGSFMGKLRFKEVEK